MPKQRQKYLAKSWNKEAIKRAVILIIDNQLETLDIKALEGMPWYYRVRVWSTRIIFLKKESWNRIYHIWPRWDIYRELKKL
jgi:hypothetical protein